MKNPILSYLYNNQFLTTLIIIAVVWFMIQIKAILILAFVSFIIMTALYPFTAFLSSKKIPNILAVLIPYLLTLVIIVSIVIPLVPFFASQIQSLFDSFPSYINRVAKLLNLHIDANDVENFITSDINAVGKSALDITGRVFGGIFSLLTILVISFYLMLGRNRLRKGFVELFPKESESKVLNIIHLVEKNLGAWTRGQLVLSFTIGIVTWIGLTAFGIPFALPLALIAGLLEIVPTIGPIIAAIPAIIVALTISPNTAIFVTLFYLLVQALENNILVPKIMEKAVGLNPVAVIIGVLIGAQFLGILGALLAVPFISMILVIIKSLKS